MSKRSRPLYVLLPCSQEQSWAVPQACLGEIVTVNGADERPPANIAWRGGDVPVLDLGEAENFDWRDSRGSTGLVAVLLGLEQVEGQAWGVAVGSNGLAIREFDEEQVEELPQERAENATAAFRYDGVIYQVPDLGAWQQGVAQTHTAALESACTQ